MRVLHIEDDDSFVRLISKMLHATGYQVTSAPDVRRGLMLAIRERPDVILLDYDLPHVSGLEAVELLRDSIRLRNIPIVMVTAYATDAEAESFLTRGCDAFVPKPVDRHRLISTIEQVVLNHRRHQFERA